MGQSELITGLVQILETENDQRNADSSVQNSENDLTYFVKPFDQIEQFNEFLDYLRHQNTYQSDGVVKYSQARKTLTVLSSVAFAEVRDIRE